MTEYHPSTPPPELVQQWAGMRPKNDAVEQNWIEIATRAAHWGADQELEAVCDEILHCVAGSYEDTVSDWSELVDLLRDSRRPKPPSLKEQALEALEREKADSCSHHNLAIIRRALEAIDD